MQDKLPQLQRLLNSLSALSDTFFQRNRDWRDCLRLAAMNDLSIDELTYTFELISKKQIQNNFSGCIKSVLSYELNQKQYSEFLMTLRHFAENEKFNHHDELFSVLKTVFSKNTSAEDMFALFRFLRQMQSHKQIDWIFLFTKLKAANSLNIPYLELSNIPKYYQTTDSVNALIRYLLAHPEFATSMTHGQLESKKWLCEKVEKIWGKTFVNIFILAGWTGSLAQMLFDHDIHVNSIRCIDIDEKACKASETLNQLQVQNNWKFKSCHMNINTLDYPSKLSLKKSNGETQVLVEMPELIINTSCEHMTEDTWWQKIPSGTKVILQSNNGFHIGEHVNCSNSLQEFIKKMNLSRLHFAGEKNMPEFNRYMLIGEK